MAKRKRQRPDRWEPVGYEPDGVLMRRVMHGDGSPGDGRIEKVPWANLDLSPVCNLCGKDMARCTCQHTARQGRDAHGPDSQRSQ